MTRNRRAAAVLAAVVGALISACGSGGGTGPSASGGSGLEAALSRVADGGNTRSQIFYDDTATLAKLAGKHYGTGFGPLIGMGASGLVVNLGPIRSQADIRLLDEQYAISAGSPPRTLGLIAGGQNAGQVTGDLTRLGWKRHGKLLVMLPLNLSNPLDGETAGWLSQVEPSGSDVIYGQQQADLSQAGAPARPTLAQDPLISALASCLGDVVAAGIFSPFPEAALKPAAVAVGVSRPGSNAAVPHAVACIAWPSAAAASRYAVDLRKALASGYSLGSNRRWSAILRHASAITIDGSAHLVEWQAQTPGDARTIFQMVFNLDLPALPSQTVCMRVPRFVASRILGCQ